MEPWKRICYLLCVYGFLREMRPSDPYFLEFIAHSLENNITQSEINRRILPVVTYSHMSQLVLLLLITDYFRYKPIILLTSTAGIIVWAMLIWTSTLLAMQIAHFFYGTFVAGEIAYYTYVYAKIDRIHFAKATAYARASMLSGKFVACSIAQSAINMHFCSYKQLHQITFVAQVVATGWAFRLPRARKSLYFHRHFSVVDTIHYPVPPMHSKDDEEIAEKISNFSSSEFEQITPVKLLWVHLKGAYTNRQVVVWSIFYACAYCGYLQVQSYVQVLWKVIDPDTKAPWNAGVDGIARLLGAIAAYLASCIEAVGFTPQAYVTFAAVLTAVQGISVYVSSMTHLITVSYVAYICFGILYSFLITIASTEVAKELESESYALVFGINTFFALLMQTILTLLVVADVGFALDVIDQYIVSSAFYMTVGFGYVAFSIYDIFKNLWR